ncbi:MAG: DUF4124 domain-containing protein [Deltaproteobacteria bacterium]|nr:DUF4124 domain-containing protein [Deltaproteobacteria bacterium]
MMKAALNLIIVGVLFFLISGSSPQVADAGIYKWTDASGRVHFSDTPPTEESVDLKEIQSDEPAAATDQKAGAPSTGMRPGSPPNPGGQQPGFPPHPGGQQPGSPPHPGGQQPAAPAMVRHVEVNPERQQIRARIGELLARRNALEDRVGGLPPAARAEREVMNQELAEIRKELSDLQNKLVKMNNPGTPTPPGKPVPPAVSAPGPQQPKPAD